MIDVRTSVVTPAPRAEWGEVVDADPHALVTQTPEWTDALVATGRYRDASRLYRLPGDRRMVVPMVARRMLPGVLASHPAAWGMGGCIADGGVESDDLRTVFLDLQGIRVPRIQIRPNPLQAGLWEAAMPTGVIRIERTAHVLDLSGGFDEVWNNRFKADTRRKARAAERAGVTVSVGHGPADIRAFFRLYDLSLERWSRRQHEPLLLARLRAGRRESVPKWERIADQLGDRLRILLARLDDRPIAGIVALQGTNAHYTRGAMDAEPAGETKANYLLHKVAIEMACAEGCRWYHMGESGQSEGLAQFKTRFGAEAHPYAEYRLERLPLTRMDQMARTAVKKVIGFRDA